MVKHQHPHSWGGSYIAASKATAAGTAVQLPSQWARYVAASLLLTLLLAVPEHGSAAQIADIIAAAQPKMVKVYGAGGFRGMEAYQSGMLVSAEGHILTVWSYVLDTDVITCVLADGQRHEAKLLGADPKLEVAVLKIDAKDLPHFDLTKAVRAEDGTRVLAMSNCFGVAVGDEPTTVQDGVVSVTTSLAARRGVFETPYRGPAYVLDAVTNNPGAAGGALITRRGELTGMLGKEMRNSLNNTWLSYALPIEELRTSVDEIRAGKFVARDDKSAEKKPAKAMKLDSLGIALVPDVLERTPCYVDSVRPGSPAAKMGVLPDDLIVLLGDRLIQSCKSLNTELEYVDYEDPVKLTIIRGQDLVEITVQPTAEPKQGTP